MYKLQMTDENILVSKVEAVKETKFEMTDDSDKRGAVYRIDHAPKDSAYSAKQLVLLGPGSYPGIYFEGVLYTVITEQDIIAKVTEEK